MYKLFCEGLAYFGMKFDGSKAAFIRFGNCDVEEITLAELDLSSHTIRYSDHVR